MYLVDMQVVVAQDIVRDFFPALEYPLVRRNRDEIFDPVHVLDVAERGHVLLVIREIVVGEKAAASVKAIDQHALAVHVREAQRPVYGGAADLTRPVFDRGEERARHLRIVNKIHLRKAQSVGAPFFVGLAAENGADAPDDLAVAIGQPAARVAVGKGRVLAAVPILQIVAVRRGDKLLDVAVELIGVINKAAQLLFRFNFDDRNHFFSSVQDSPYCIP